MPSCSIADIVLVAYPFTDLENRKVRPAIIISPSGEQFDDVFIVPMTSRLENLETGEFVLPGFLEFGLNVPTAVKRGCVLIDSSLILKRVGQLDAGILDRVRQSLRVWLALV
jgi:mRNA-degrading endonuclease toxin of MazEF toxin-antitoxin module